MEILYAWRIVYPPELDWIKAMKDGSFKIGKQLSYNFVKNLNKDLAEQGDQMETPGFHLLVITSSNKEYPLLVYVRSPRAVSYTPITLPDNWGDIIH